MIGNLNTENAKDLGRRIVEDVTKVGHDAWLAGLGVVATIEEEGRDVFGTLVEKGKAWQPPVLDKTPVGEFVDQAAEQVKTIGHKLEAGVQDTTKAVLHRFGMPTHQEVEALIARVEQLNAKIEALARKEAE